MSKDKIRILYLDDEENNLTSFKAAYRRDYKIFTTTTASEAVQILTDNEIHLVISDQKMPSLSGVEFFELIIPDFPDPIRMLLTGYADIEAVIDAINKGQVFRYIAKPWNEQELKITIENAYEVYLNRKEIKDKTQKLEKAYEELEKFVYSASHDLRAPLVSILGVVKLARAEAPEAQSLEYLEMIEKSVNKLDAFVQNIINYYQNLKKDEILSSVNWQDMLHETIENYKHFEGADRISFNTRVDQPDGFTSDELRIKIVLNNLVSNAIKYSDFQKPESKVDVNISCGPHKTIVEVEDNGIGISEENKERLFEMFYRSSESDQGSGIGLYIVKEAVEKLGGAISVESNPGTGSKFSVEIPNKA
jgi:two-component system sensor histidine kinase/response regulator